MSLLHDIQIRLLDDNANIGSILLKVRYLADRLGSASLEDWVRFEAEGYPDRSNVPEYRVSGVTYTGSLTDGYKNFSNIGIPPHIITKYGGEGWTSYGITDALPVIESMLARNNGDGEFGIDASNLKLLLDNKIFRGYTLLDIDAKLDVGAFARIGAAVRAKLLDLVLALEKQIPEASKITVGTQAPAINDITRENVTQVFNQTIHGNVTNIANSGSAASISVNVLQGDVASLEKALAALGLTPGEASELANIAAGEKPEGGGKGFGARAAEWIGKRLSAGADGVMRIGGRVLEDEIGTAIQGFYDNLPPIG